MSNVKLSMKDWLLKIENQHEKNIDLNLERIKEVAYRASIKIDSSIITVGGTNGKGSTCAILESIFIKGGYQVGLYSSPHLVTFNERARINGKCLSDKELIEGFEKIENSRGIIKLTYFEFTTLAIAYHFSKLDLDLVILEVGMGGRLDAVNIFEPDLSIVTSIDLDHTNYLGNSREEIALEKAGIFRKGKVAICSDPCPPKSLKLYAENIGTDLWIIGREFGYQSERNQWNYIGKFKNRNALCYPSLRGVNQLLNASAALAALEVLHKKFPLSAQDIKYGLAQIDLKGRFQVLAGFPTVILDVAHNTHSAAALSNNLENMGFYPYTFGIFGIMSDKDISKVIDKVKENIDYWYLCKMPSVRSASYELLLKFLLKAGISDNTELNNKNTIQCYDSVKKAFDNARFEAGENDRIVVFGSFEIVTNVINLYKKF